MSVEVIELGEPVGEYLPVLDDGADGFVCTADECSFCHWAEPSDEED